MNQKYNFCPPLIFMTLKMLANKTAMYIGEAINVHRANASSMVPSNSAAPNPNSNAPVVMPNLIMPPTPNPTDSNHGFCNCPSGC